MWISALLLGLLGSFHCIGMCGPIAFLLPLDRNNPRKRTLQVFLYHFGRVFTYSTLGAIFGLLGKTLSIFGIQQQLSIAIGVLMILVVLLPKKTGNKYNIAKPVYRWVSKIKSALGKELKKKTPDTFFTIGFLNGFLPCGLVYMAVFASIAMGDIVKGSLYMALFGIGTIPLMTSAIYLGTIITGKIKTRIRKSIPVFIVLFGLLFILRGLGLGIPYVSPKPMVSQVEADHSCNATSLENVTTK